MTLLIRHTLRIRARQVLRDGRLLAEDGHPTGLYRAFCDDYPKFFKMDALCRLGFVASELLLQAEAETERFVPREDRAVVLMSHSGSLGDDLHFQQSLDEIPSPALFVYTLPNIVTGEIAIRNGYRGETCAYVADGFDPDLLMDSIQAAFADPLTHSALCGWVDCPGEDAPDALLMLVERAASTADKREGSRKACREGDAGNVSEPDTPEKLCDKTLNSKTIDLLWKS